MLDSPDNICITPRGGIIFCEDDASGGGESHPLAPDIADVNRLTGVGGWGRAVPARGLSITESEFASACFSPDCRVMLVNLLGDREKGNGMACCDLSPWERGPL